MELKYVYTDEKNIDFQNFSKLIDDYFNKLVGGEKNRKNFIQYNSLEKIHDVFIAYDKNYAVGCAGLRRYDEDTAEIKRVFVREEYRGKGISKRLMLLLEERAAEIGFKSLVLQTRQACTEAIGLYLSLGYLRINNYPPYDKMPLAVCFKKSID